MARDLDLAITLATRLYPKDIEIALKTITVLFNYESQQNSSTLISAKNHQFAQVWQNNISFSSLIFSVN